MRRTFTLLGLAMLAVASLGSSGALAAKPPPPPSGTLDQQYAATPNTGFGVSAGQYVAQTYTAGIAGSLLQVRVYLDVDKRSNPTGPLQVSIYAASSSLPSGSALYTSPSFTPHLPSYPNYAWVSVSIPAGTVAQTAGSDYAIALTSSSVGNKPYLWNGVTPGSYSGGQVDTESFPPSPWQPASTPGFGPTSLDFQTYVG